MYFTILCIIAIRIAKPRAKLVNYYNLGTKIEISHCIVDQNDGVVTRTMARQCPAGF